MRIKASPNGGEPTFDLLRHPSKHRKVIGALQPQSRAINYSKRCDASLLSFLSLLSETISAPAVELIDLWEGTEGS